MSEGTASPARAPSGLASESAIVAIGSLTARALAFAFSVVLAISMTPAAFGRTQFSIAAAFFLTVLAQPIGQHVVARYVALANDDDSGAHHDHERDVAHLWLLFSILTIVSVLAAIIAARVSASISAFTVFPVLGIAVYHGYFGLARGHAQPRLLVAAYVGSNALQLVAVAALFFALDVDSSDAAVAVYGLSYLPVLAVLVYRWPLRPMASIRTGLDWGVMQRLARFSAPVTTSNLVFIAFLYGDVLLLQSEVGAEGVGRYSLAKTIATVFYVAPAAVSTVLLPALVNRHDAVASRRSTVAALGVALVGIAAYVVAIGPSIGWVFGGSYELDRWVHAALAVAMAALGFESVIGTTYLARGRPEAEVAARLCGLLVLAVCSAIWIPRAGEAGAAGSLLAAAIASVVAYSVVPRRMRTTASA